ncbi:hypothetical protein EYF80_040387 [Liparis tanakae]|uniref:Uncharacterized protein n=1 Tax=Liparis tanakae TaxID=230148 RepID=A0A4Z2GA50_9TELE|nr:hypothetical protein EYF80_040387 [Liparis tanakae]
MSRTSVGVVERSCPSPMLLVSMATACCGRRACRRLVSSSASICSRHARRQAEQRSEVRGQRSEVSSYLL